MFNQSHFYIGFWLVWWSLPCRYQLECKMTGVFSYVALILTPYLSNHDIYVHWYTFLKFNYDNRQFLWNGNGYMSFNAWILIPSFRMKFRKLQWHCISVKMFSHRQSNVYRIVCSCQQNKLLNACVRNQAVIDWFISRRASTVGRFPMS